MGQKAARTAWRYRDMIGKIFLLGLSSFALAGEPGVFDAYFDDGIKEVDISIDSAIKGCLTNGETFAEKVKKAYNKAFGNDYDFDDLADAGGADDDDDGLPDSFEENEAEFYKEMGWVDGSAVKADVIKADLTGLDSDLKTGFDNNIDACAAWNGNFGGSRRKREAGDDETDEEIAAVPAVMENGSAALSWLRSAVRKTRSADPGNENGKGKGRGKGKGGKGRNAKGKGKGKGGNGRGKGGKGRNAKGKGKGNGKGRGKGKGEGRNAKGKVKGKGKGKGKGKETNGNSGGSGRKSSDLEESTYNQLWCFDLSLEQVLEKCVEAKIKA